MDLHSSVADLVSFGVGNLLLLLIALLGASPRQRTRMRQLLNRLDHKGEAGSAAIISSFIGGMKPKEAMQVARDHFRGVPVDEVQRLDLQHARRHDGRVSGDTLALHSHAAAFGGVDAFVSHAWADDHNRRYDSLLEWAAEFEATRGRRPVI